MRWAEPSGDFQKRDPRRGAYSGTRVVTKLLLTVLATIILLVHTQPIDRVAAVAAETTLSTSDLRQVRIQLVADAGAALFVLLVTTTLSVYQPWGMSAYGLRKQDQVTAVWRPTTLRRPDSWGRYMLIGIIGLALLAVLLHLAGGWATWPLDIGFEVVAT